jgi:hypothetical protein
LPAQHPEVQLAAVQVQVPPTQTRPTPHAGPEPHLHWPLAQVSVVGGHELHIAEPEPHASGVVGLTHVPPLQQVGHCESTSQTQPPATQRRPAPHADPEPHLQLPDASQVSASKGLQAGPQLPPGRPQWLRLGVKHALPAPLSQQPLGHDIGLQTHAPLTQRWPGLQAAAPPHLQAPPAQLSATTFPRPSGAAQSTHTSAPVPQAPVACVNMHVPFVQQPLQLAALQPEQPDALQV